MHIQMQRRHRARRAQPQRSGNPAGATGPFRSGRLARSNLPTLHRLALLAALLLAPPAALRAGDANHVSPVGLSEEDRRTVEDKTRDSGTKALAVGELVPGPFQPAYESLKAYKCPDWYQDA